MKLVVPEPVRSAVVWPWPQTVAKSTYLTALRGFAWVDPSVKTPTWRRRHSRRACFPGQGRGGPPRGRCRHAMAAGALVPPGATHVATVYTNAPKRLREAIFANLCTLLRHHGRSRDRAGLRVPRHQRPHGPRDARALGPDTHAARVVTQLPSHTDLRSCYLT